MGRGGVDVWEVTLLRFGAKRAAACRAILASEFRKEEESNLEEWYYGMLAAIEMLADKKVECQLPAGDPSTSISDEVACSLFDISDHFGMESVLNTDGFFTYAQIADPVTLLRGLRSFSNSPSGTSVLNAENEDNFLTSHWAPEIQFLEEFLVDCAIDDGTELVVQLVTAN